MLDVSRDNVTMQIIIQTGTWKGLSILSKPGYIIPFWMKVMIGLIWTVSLADYNSKDVSIGNWKWGVFQEHRDLCNPKFPSASAEGGWKRGQVLLMAPQLPAASFTYKLGMPVEETHIFFLLLTVFSVKIPNDYKSIFNKTFKMLMSHSPQWKLDPVWMPFKSGCKQWGPLVARMFPGRPLTTSQNKLEEIWAITWSKGLPLVK